MLWKDGASVGFPTSRVYGPPWLPETQSCPPAPCFRKSARPLCPRPGPEGRSVGGTEREWLSPPTRGIGAAQAGEEEGMWAELGSRGAVLMGVSDGGGADGGELTGAGAGGGARREGGWRWRGYWKGLAGTGVGGYRTSAPPSTFPARIWGTAGCWRMAPTPPPPE